jgi:SAM-dependent methyltransferase
MNKPASQELIFGPAYASAYDALYADKNYADECALIDSLIKKRGTGQTIVDLGCGTGNHSVALAQMGYSLVGVDCSESMLAQARAKAALDFRLGDIRTIDLGKQFDCVLLLFAVLGYQLEDRDVRATLENVHRHLRPGGLFMFDVWYGPAVLRQRPSERVKIASLANGEIRRAASSTLDEPRHVCSVDYRSQIFRDAQLIAEFHERHDLRYFFRAELESFLAGAGLELIRLGAFPDFDRDPGEDTWNVLGVAQRSGVTPST